MSARSKVRVCIEVEVFGEGKTTDDAIQAAMKKMRELRVVTPEGERVWIVDGPKAMSFGLG